MTLRKVSRQGLKSADEVAARAKRILKILDATMPHVRVELDSTSPLELLMATILSAQCTDERVNQVTPRLFPSQP